MIQECQGPHPDRCRSCGQLPANHQFAKLWAGLIAKARADGSRVQLSEVVEQCMAFHGLTGAAEP